MNTREKLDIGSLSEDLSEVFGIDGLFVGHNRFYHLTLASFYVDLIAVTEDA